MPAVSLWQGRGEVTTEAGWGVGSREWGGEDRAVKTGARKTKWGMGGGGCNECDLWDMMA